MPERTADLHSIFVQCSNRIDWDHFALCCGLCGAECVWALNWEGSLLLERYKGKCIAGAIYREAYCGSDIQGSALRGSYTRKCIARPVYRAVYCDANIQ